MKPKLCDSRRDGVLFEEKGCAMPMGITELDGQLSFVVEFGEGDIACMPAYRPGGQYGAWGLGQLDSKREVGAEEVFDEPKSLREMKPQIVMTFSSLKSLDTAIESLSKLRAAFI